MAWKKSANVAQYKGADWDNVVQKASAVTPQQAMRIARLTPAITFFFHCREPMVLEGPVEDRFGPFEPGDAVFFSGEPWFGDAPQADSYQKTGLSVVYIDPADPAQVTRLAGYTLADGAPAIDVVCLFAGNYASASAPYLRANNNDPVTQDPLNPNIRQVLDAGLVQALQARGITVLLTVTNGWADVGWSEFTDVGAASDFATWLATRMVAAYGLDGIDIDDEYSAGTPNDTSLIMVTSQMREAMPDKMITKALVDDHSVFGATWRGARLSDHLTYGWEMSYFRGGADARLHPYTQWGMDKTQLVLGFSAEDTFRNDWPGVAAETAATMTAGYGGAMLFAFENQPASLGVMKDIVDAIHGPGNWNG